MKGQNSCYFQESLLLQHLNSGAYLLSFPKLDSRVDIRVFSVFVRDWYGNVGFTWMLEVMKASSLPEEGGTCLSVTCLLYMLCLSWLASHWYIWESLSLCS